VSFSTDGVYVLRLSANDGALVSADDVVVTVAPEPVQNTAPIVNAGADFVHALPPNHATLSGSVSDDGLPNPPGAVTTVWTQVSGPGTATISDANLLRTRVTFPVDGLYIFRLTADDGDLTGSDDVVVTVMSKRSR